MSKNNMTNNQETEVVRSIVTADAPYVGNVMRIPKDIQQKARMLCWKYNTTDPTDSRAMADILKELLGTWSEQVVIMPHVQFDYGINTHFLGGHFTFVNFDCVFLDTSPIYIGEDVFVGQSVCLLAPDIPSIRSSDAPNRSHRASLSA